MVPRSLPSTANATGSKMSKSCSADRSRDSVGVLSVFLLKLTSKIAACPFLSSSDFHRGEKILRNQFLRGLTGHCFCSNDIPLSHSHQATPFHLLVSCQPLPSRSHERSCFQNSLRSDSRGSSVTLNFSFGETGLYMFSALRNSLFRLKEPMLLKGMLHWYVDKVEVNVWACLSHGLWDASAIIKPCSCVSVFVGGTVHLFRVTVEVLHCSVFSKSRIGNSLYWWRHVTSSHRKPLFVTFNWFPCLKGCSVRSSGRLLIAHAKTWQLPLRLIAQAILSLVPLLHFHGAWIYS